MGKQSKAREGHKTNDLKKKMKPTSTTGAIANNEVKNKNIKEKRVKNKLKSSSVAGGLVENSKKQIDVVNPHHLPESSVTKIPKKIVFIDDEPKEITQKNLDKIINHDNKKYLNEDEAHIKDEDIDEFIDELDEEDNQQFEDWVKLIEAKLHPVKRKT